MSEFEKKLVKSLGLVDGDVFAETKCGLHKKGAKKTVKNVNGRKERRMAAGRKMASLGYFAQTESGCVR